MTGLEVLAAAAVGYLIRKARRVGRRVDADVDQVLDAGMDALDDLVTGRLGTDGALETLRRQAGRGEVSERTERRTVDVIAETAEIDATFAAALGDLIERLQRRERALGVIAVDGGVAAGGDITMHAETGGVIARDITGPLTTGPLTIATPPVAGPPPARADPHLPGRKG
jgi:hypothetical protein